MHMFHSTPQLVYVAAVSQNKRLKLPVT
jgi:hypothetical protein